MQIPHCSRLKVSKLDPRSVLRELTILRPSHFDDVEERIRILEFTRNELEQQLAQSRRLRNSLLPLYQLPAELFSEILMHYFDDKWRRRTEDLAHLAGVSQRWRDFILSSPALWTHVDITTGMEDIQLHLRRSGSLPIYVEATGVEQFLDGYTHLLDAIWSTAGRWAELKYTRLNEALPECFSIMIDQPPEHLSSLSVTDEYDKFEQDVLEIELGPSDSLQSVHFNSVTLSRCFDCWKSLSSISLRSCKADQGALFDAIKGSQCLRSLRLEMYDGRDDDSFASATPMSNVTDAYTFPCLEELVLEHCSGSFVKDVILHLNTPALSTFSLEYVFADFPDDDMLPGPYPEEVVYRTILEFILFTSSTPAGSLHALLANSYDPDSRLELALFERNRLSIYVSDGTTRMLLQGSIWNRILETISGRNSASENYFAALKFNFDEWNPELAFLTTLARLMPQVGSVEVDATDASMFEDIIALLAAKHDIWPCLTHFQLRTQHMSLARSEALDISLETLANVRSIGNPAVKAELVVDYMTRRRRTQQSTS